MSNWLSNNERIIVEAIRNAPKVQIIVPGYDGKTGETRITVEDSKFSHDVAISLQSYYVNTGSVDKADLFAVHF